MDDEANAAFDRIEGRIAPEAFKGMWRSFSEALVNSVQHAYIEPRGTAGSRMRSKRWWMLTQELEGELTVMVCDLGIGIPRSLPLKWEESVVAQLISKFDSSKGPDVKAIRTALEISKTRTQEAHRGKGLPQIWQAVREVSGRGVSIFSNRARLTWNGATDKEHEFEYSDSIKGTIVAWSVKTIDGDNNDHVY
ncbi:ATP-binding protein [Aurantiacibacter flavus]|uniref:ATP-binding protein n=1 Tax=Aurantiacibacter flavus TaxID=3145232 RepID=A0ABV0CSX4_9SPHN